MRRLTTAMLIAALTAALVPMSTPQVAAAATLKVGLVSTTTAQNTRHYLTGASINGYYDSRIGAVETLLKEEGFEVGLVNDSALSSLSALKAYDVLVFPRTLAMTGVQRDAVRAYCAEGGGVVASFGMSRWDCNTAYQYDYMPFIGMSSAPGLYTWPPSSEALKPWEWGDVSEMYNVKFKNDDLMYGGYKLAPKPASSHWILSQSEAEAGSLTMTPTKDDYNEVTYTLPGATNVTPLYTYNTLSNSNGGDNADNGYLAGWSSEYYFGRFVYFGFQLHDLTRGGIYADDATERVAERVMVNSIKWAGEQNGYNHLTKRVDLTGKAWYSKGVLYIDETVKNTGNVSLRGPLEIEVRTPTGSKAYSGKAYNNNCPLPPGDAYTHRSYQVRVTPTAGTWSVTMTYKYYDRFRDGTVTVRRIMWVKSTGTTMATSGYSDQVTIGGNLPPVGERIAGATRYDTAVELSERGWPNGVSPDTEAVVLATGSNYPDALAAAPLAGKLDAPVLLVPSSELTSKLRTELQRLYAGRTYAKLYVVGGEGAVSNKVVEDATRTLKNVGVESGVTRLAGANRWETAAKIAQAVGAPSENSRFNKTAFIVSGQNYPDALAIGALAANEQVPILLVTKTEVPYAAQAMLKELGVQHSTILGGTGVVGTGVESWLESNGYRVGGVPDGSSNVDTRLGGATRYDTALQAVGYSVAMGGFDDGTLYFATGANWPDALALASVAGKNANPLVLINGGEIGSSTQVADYLCGKSTENPSARFVGGEGAISDYVRGQAKVALDQ